MAVILIGVGGLATSALATESIRTLALGSCVALIMLDPATRCVGMCHVALPSSDVSPEKADAMPGYFADTAVPALLANMSRLGCNPKGLRFLIKLVGGANVSAETGQFCIGKRNVLALRKTLWKHQLAAVAEDVGGSLSRTVEISTCTGMVLISSPGCPDKEI